MMSKITFPKREPLKINFFILTDAETYQICTLRTLRNPLRTLRLNPNYFNRKGRKDYAKDAKNVFLEGSLLQASHKGTKRTKESKLS